MAKKKIRKKTFAQRAKDVVEGYKRADWDPIEKAALNSKLQALQEEQENYKQSVQEDNYACGGKMYPDGGYLTSKSGLLPTVSEEEFGLIEPQGAPEIAETQESQYTPYQTSIAPSLISGATSALGNLYLANQQRNISNVNLPRISAPQISLERGRQAASREATRAGQRIKYATRGGTRTRGEYMANRLAGEAQVSGRLGETLSASHEKEALVNANMQSGMNKFNAEMAAKEEMINNAQKIKNKAEREAYIAAAIGTIPQMTRDISATRAQDQMINVLGDKYGWYMEQDPSAKWYQRRKKPTVKFRG